MRKQNSELEKSGVEESKVQAQGRRKTSEKKQLQEAQVMEEERGWMEAKSPSIPSPCTGQFRGGV